MPLPPASRVDLPPEAASVGQARQFVAGVLTDWGLSALIDTVSLLTSELATNAVLHARTGFAVMVSRDDHVVRVDVLDKSTVTPKARQPSPSAATGRGVAIVAQLAEQWGQTGPEALHGFAKGVFFTVSA